jgi:hypothetical protein
MFGNDNNRDSHDVSAGFTLVTFIYLLLSTRVAISERVFRYGFGGDWDASTLTPLCSRG